MEAALADKAEGAELEQRCSHAEAALHTQRAHMNALLSGKADSTDLQDLQQKVHQLQHRVQHEAAQQSKVLHLLSSAAG